VREQLRQIDVIARRILDLPAAPASATLEDEDEADDEEALEASGK
jgi:hypothetical protein